MQSSPFSVYNTGLDLSYKETLEFIYATCPGKSGPTEIHAPVITLPEDPVSCFTEAIYTTKNGDTCDSIAQTHSVASAALREFNSKLHHNCTEITVGIDLCLPLTCDTPYILQNGDTCESIEFVQDLDIGTVRRYNPWINFWCDNLQTTIWTNGRTICLTPQVGYYNITDPIPGELIAPGESTGYTGTAIPPPSNATVANGTTLYCGRWYEVSSADDTCVSICTSHGITIGLFRALPELAPQVVPGCCELDSPIAWDLFTCGTRAAPMMN
ncbi:uncharacterized protein N7473_005258 [Penicillium subrubescens]|nr:uncharacterized protein N7473_005258 [Penicillium subrubescens]KAJ5895859.1 hypothetical protein N7473_005258 [Penicillium subrubescens]